MTVQVSEIQLDPNDKTKTSWGGDVADQFHLAWANGTAADDTFSAVADISSATQTVMSENQRGVFVELGDGNDTAAGSAYGDNFAMGAGTNFVDGGDDLGAMPWGDPARDSLDIFVANLADAGAVTVTPLGPDSVGADGDAFAGGYVAKVVSGTETTYVKNVEQVNVQVWNDQDSDGVKDWGAGEVSFARNIGLTVAVSELQVQTADPTKTSWGDNVSNMFHFAWANGGPGADSFNAATHVTQATLDRMDIYQRGLFVEMGAGDDTAIGSAYGDNFTMGAGTNFVDGGANAGTTPWGDAARDAVEVFVANTAESTAVSVVALDAAATGADKSAFDAGYTGKVVSGAETTYIKNVEAVHVQIWNDANGNGQKDWATEVNFGRYIPLAVNVNELQVNGSDPTKTAWGDDVANMFHFAWANGGPGADAFDATTDVGLATRNRMDSYQRGVYADMGAGNDTVVGSAYGDNFTMGAGTNYVDGGGNAGMTPWGDSARDQLDVFVANSTAASAVTVIALEATATGADKAAFDAGYTGKLVAGAETTYLKNIEGVNVQIWNDANGNGQRDWGNGEVNYARHIQLALTVNELQVSNTDDTKTAWGDPISNMFHLAWANGGPGGESFDAATQVSATTLARMDTYQRGLYVDMGAGNDTATGSGYGDNFVMGAGTNYVDGGADAGVTPWGDAARDNVEVFVANTTAAAAVSVLALDAGATGDDKAAFDAGYTGKVIAGAETTYIKNVEGVQVQVWNDANGNGQKDWGTEVTFGRYIPLSLNVNEVQVSNTDDTKTNWGEPLTNMFHFAWANGSPGADSFNAATDVSATTLARMDTYGRGLYVDGGAGNDTATGSGYGDNFVMGAGTNYVDGGANAGTTPWGDAARDQVEVYVADATAAAAVTVVALDATATGGDKAAFDAGYTGKVLAGAEITYIKNIEGVSVSTWADHNKNGQRDWDNSEVSFVRYMPLSLTVNEIQVSNTDDTKTNWGESLTNMFHFAWANGSPGADSFDAATDVSATTLARMDTYGRGLYVDGGAGNDTAIGSGYGDNFVMGAGTNYVDGGANAGTSPWGDSGRDQVEVYVADAAAASAVTVAALDGTATGGDKAAFDAGYTGKVVAGAETTYIKNVEGVSISIWDDQDVDGQRDWQNEVSFARYVPLALTVNEQQVSNVNPAETPWGAPLSSMFHLAWANGAPGADHFDAATDISLATLGRMDTYQRGVNVDLGAGDDTAVGSAYGDNFSMGAGTNYVDGGDDKGTTPWGDPALDTIDVYVANQTDANAVGLVTLTAAATGADKAAFDAGYTGKVTAGAETTYVKNVEALNVQVWDDANANGQRDYHLGEVNQGRYVPLVLSVNEVRVSESDPTKSDGGQPLADMIHLAWANGGPGADAFNAATHISATTLARMDSYKRGVWGDLGAGNDTAVGTAYGDSFAMGSGTNYVDGGANTGSNQYGLITDNIQVYVGSASAVDGVTVTVLGAASTGDDLAAFNNGYTAKVVAGDETTYTKNVEHLSVQVWNDADGNGQKDWATEVSPGRHVQLALSINELAVSATDNTKDAQGNPLSNAFHFAWANGWAGDDVFDAATHVSAETLGRMGTYQRGLSVDLGAGNDTATGSAYGDNFVMGTGTDYVDGGDDLGDQNGNPAQDTLDVYIASQGEGDALQLVQLNGASTGEDAAAYAAGYAVKFVNGGSVTYLKNVERINAMLWSDANGNGMRDMGETNFFDGVNLVPQVFVNTGDAATLTNMFHLGSVNATPLDDVLNLAAGSPLIPSELQSNMDTYRHGLFVTTEDGNDTITGTSYNDNFEAGAGTNYVDGGANLGMSPGNASTASTARDALQFTVTSSAQAAAITTTQLSSSSTGADLTAFDNGYQFKVVNPATGETSYVKNVEAVQVRLWTDSDADGQMDFSAPSEVVQFSSKSLATWSSMNVPSLTNRTPTKGFQLGTQFGDSLDAADMFSALNVMFDPANPFGAFQYALGGNNTVVGTAGNDFQMVTQHGSNLIDGGTDAGYFSYGNLHSAMALDQYRMQEQRSSTEVPNAAATNGGLTGASFTPGNYRLVDLTKWSGYQTQSLMDMGPDAASQLVNGITSANLSTTDVSNIAGVAAQLGLTMPGADGYDYAIVKYNSAGTLLGVDFLRDVEQVQLGMWYDSSRNDVPNGNETALYATYTIAQDSYTLGAGHESWMWLQFTDNATYANRHVIGWANGTSFADTVDASGLAIPGTAPAGAGFAMSDFGQNDSLVGSAGGDAFFLGAGNDTVQGGAGTDTAVIIWRPDAALGNATLSKSSAISNGVTTITVSQTQNGVTTPLLTATNDGSDASWTIATTGSAADAIIRPNGTTTAGLGVDVLLNVEHMTFQLGATTAIDTGGVTIETGFNVELVGVVI